MSSIDKQDLLRLRQLDVEFTNLVHSSSRDDIANCAKFLAMYIALYRQKFGEISAEEYNRLMDRSKLDDESLAILEEGMDEASAMLKLVLLQKGGNDISRYPGRHLH